MSKRLAKSMGGDITVASQPGKGSTFTLTVHAPAVAEEVEDTFENDDMPLPALHVLLVEDIELNVIVARSVLEKLGNSVDVAMTGKAALEMFTPGEYDGAARYSATGHDRTGYLPRADAQICS